MPRYGSSGPTNASPLQRDAKLTSSSATGSAVSPKLSEASFNELRVFEDWWNQVVMVIDRTPITRKQLVLAAANKDGGAHVDSKLTREYEKLAADGALGHFLGEPMPNIPITDGHLMALRQVGFEVLHSPDVTRMAEAAPQPVS
jgi:hypothetical protein